MQTIWPTKGRARSSVLSRNVKHRNESAAGGGGAAMKPRPCSGPGAGNHLRSSESSEGSGGGPGETTALFHASWRACRWGRASRFGLCPRFPRLRVPHRHVRAEEARTPGPVLRGSDSGVPDGSLASDRATLRAPGAPRNRWSHAPQTPARRSITCRSRLTP